MISLYLLQVKIWFQNRRNKWKRQIATDADGLGIGMSAAAAVAGVMTGSGMFGSLPTHFHPYSHLQQHQSHAHATHSTSSHPGPFPPRPQPQRLHLHPNLRPIMHSGPFNAQLPFVKQNGMQWPVQNSLLHGPRSMENRSERMKSLVKDERRYLDYPRKLGIQVNKRPTVTSDGEKSMSDDFDSNSTAKEDLK